VDVKDSSVTSADDVLVIENGELSLENVGSLDRLLHITDDETV
jgi:hypothetical protein